MCPDSKYTAFLTWLSVAAPSLAILASWGKEPTTMSLFRHYLDGIKPHELIAAVA